MVSDRESARIEVAGADGAARGDARRDPGPALTMVSRRRATRPAEALVPMPVSLPVEPTPPPARPPRSLPAHSSTAPAGSGPARPPAGRIWRRSLLLVASLGLTLVLLELGLRFAGVEPRTPRWFDPALGWRFFPGQVVVMRSGGVDLGRASIDAGGYRAPAWPPPHPPGTLAVACVGDSATFGWPVGDEQTWPARLQQELDRSLGPQWARVRNFGVPGWNTVNEAQQYAIDVRPWQPSIVLIGFSLNDLQPEDRGPSHVSGPLFRLARDTALLVAFHQYLRPALPRSWFEPAAEPPELAALRRQYAASWEQVLARPEGVGEPYWERTTRALTRLVTEARRDGAQVALIVFPSKLQVEAAHLLGLGADGSPPRLGALARPQQQLAAIASRLDLPLVDLAPAFVVADPPPGEPGAALFHPQDPGHPSAAGYRVVAEHVLDLLEREGWLPPR